MKEDRKDFYKVTDLSEWFRTWTAEQRDPKAADWLMWQARFQCAIAQQLTIIAGHLGKIVGKAEELSK